MHEYYHWASQTIDSNHERVDLLTGRKGIQSKRTFGQYSQCRDSRHQMQLGRSFTAEAKLKSNL